MNDLRQHTNQNDGLLRPQGGADDAGAGAARLGAARGDVAQLNAAADRILDSIRQGNSTRFLDQVRQLGGQ